MREAYQQTVSEEPRRDDRIYKQMKLGVARDQKFARFRQSRRHGIVGFTQLGQKFRWAALRERFK